MHKLSKVYMNHTLNYVVNWIKFEDNQKDYIGFSSFLPGLVKIKNAPLSNNNQASSLFNQQAIAFILLDIA